MNPELEVLKAVTGRLDGVGIGYMVTGSMALNYYAVPRMTRDIDVVVELSAGDAERLVALFHDDFYIDPEAVRGAIDQRGTFNAIHTDSVVKVDFVVRKESEYRQTEFSRRRRASVEGHEFFIVAPEDLNPRLGGGPRPGVPRAVGHPSEPGGSLPGGGRVSANTSAGDTSPEVARAFRAMLLRRPPEERLKMGCSMHAAAQALVKESVLASVPLAAAATLRQALFLRFYGHEFDSEARERVLARLSGDKEPPRGSGGAQRLPPCVR